MNRVGRIGLILHFTCILAAGVCIPSSASAQTPPVIPAQFLGERVVNWDYSGLRPIPAVPAVGVHPRIFFGPDQLADVRFRLTNTVAGCELFTNMLQRYTAILRLGRSAGYDVLPTSLKTMPDGTSRISNIGLYDKNIIYTNLVAGQTNELYKTFTNSSASTLIGVLSGDFAMEAFECLILQGQSGVGQRATNLAVAMDTWATYVMNDPNYDQDEAWRFGRHDLAEAYDFNYWAMTDAQRVNVRKAICRGIRFKKSAGSTVDYYQGLGLAPEANTSNWAALDTDWLLMMCAIEGETSAAVEGYSSEYVGNFFTNAMGCLYSFYTYGWHPSGEPYEGMGKNYNSASRMIAFARRGYNFFGHPHLRNYAERQLPAIMQPFGYSWNHYDVLGGGGSDNERGKKYFATSDKIGIQWVHTNSPAAGFIWRNLVKTAWKTNGNWQEFYDFRDSKFQCRGDYWNDLVEAACFLQDPPAGDWNAANQAALGSLDWLDVHGSTIVARSDFSSNAVALQFHTRQDFGGHTFAERGGFSLSAQGRIWIRFHTGAGSGGSWLTGQYADLNTQILVDGLASYVAPQEGEKMRVPSKLAGWASTTGALFATCDSTYSYTWQWKWNNYTNTGTVTISSGYAAETNCFNNFRRSNNRIPESYGNAPFVSFPQWNTPNYCEGIQRKSYNLMRQVIRTAGLVRGAHPYALVIDDIRKDDASHTYNWLAQIPTNLTLLAGGILPPGCNPATDAVLQEPATNGSRMLLVRIASPTNWSAVVETPTNDFTRLNIATTNVQPDFKIILYPFAAGEAIPTTAWTTTNTMTMNISGQSDTFVFSPRTTATTDGRSVVTSDFLLTRGGSTLVDYRGQIEPFATTAQLAVSPVIQSATRSGAKLVIAGTNGAAAAAYIVLAATNAVLPRSNWTPVATNQFGAGGSFTFTNALDATTAQKFYLLKLP